MLTEKTTQDATTRALYHRWKRSRGITEVGSFVRHGSSGVWLAHQDSLVSQHTERSAWRVQCPVQDSLVSQHTEKKELSTARVPQAEAGSSDDVAHKDLLS